MITNERSLMNTNGWGDRFRRLSASLLREFRKLNDALLSVLSLSMEVDVFLDHFVVLQCSSVYSVLSVVKK